MIYSVNPSEEVSPPPPFLEELEARLLEAARSGAALVSEPTIGLLRAGGKRVRPQFALLVGEMLDAPPPLVKAVATAVELTHTATLLHDDVIDRSATRRGMPSVHEKFGMGSAILTGDYLLAKSLRILTQDKLYAATHELTIAMCDLVEAELLQAELQFNPAATLEQSRAVATGKTGTLFAWCARALASSMGLSENIVMKADELGRLLGYAFQVADDLLDFGPAPAGKPIRKDLREGQLTVPVQLARAGDTALDAAISKAFSSKQEGDFDSAYQLLQASQVRELGLAELNRCREQVREGALSLTRNEETPAALLAFFDSFAVRRTD